MQQKRSSGGSLHVADGYRDVFLGISSGNWCRTRVKEREEENGGRLMILLMLFARIGSVGVTQAAITSDSSYENNCVRATDGDAPEAK
jgi:hypothetical protein